MDRSHGMSQRNYSIGAGKPEFFTCYTLVDITKTGVISSYKDFTRPFLDDKNDIITDEASWIRSRNKQTNWEMLVQCISMRAQPALLEEPVKLVGTMHEYNFGSLYTGIGNIWMFSFATEAKSVYAIGNDPVAVLKSDIKNIPVLTGLDESYKFPSKVFQTLHPEFCNIMFSSGHNITHNYVEK